MFGNNLGQMKQMMEQMGIDMEEINAEKITVETEDGKELLFEDVVLNKMDAQNEEIYQIMGSPKEELDKQDGNARENEDNEENTDDGSSVDSQEITEDDIELVALRAGVDEDTAEEALRNNDGDLAKSISSLED